MVLRSLALQLLLFSITLVQTSAEASAMQIYYVRHAESERNVDPLDRIGGQNNWIEITEKGKEEARLLGEYFAREKIEFDAIYCSPAIRTQQTARYCFQAGKGVSLFQGDMINLDRRLLEQHKGDFAGRPKQEVLDLPEFMHHDDGPRHYRPGVFIKGESELQVASRMQEFLDEVIQRHKGKRRILCISHGNALRCLMETMQSYDEPIKIRNTALTVFKYDDAEGKVREVIVDDVPHLPHLS